MACETYKECTNQDISPEDMFRLLIRTDALGCPALAIVRNVLGSDNCDTHIVCANKELSWKDLFFLIVAIDSNGCPAIRTVELP